MDDKESVTYFRNTQRGKLGAHYSIFEFKSVDALKHLFLEDGELKVNEMNFCLFSTSGVHGSYNKIEEIEVYLNKYGDDQKDGDEDDQCGNHLTALIIQPRLVCMRYADIDDIKIEDIPFLKELRQKSWDVFSQIGGRPAWINL